MDKLATNIQPAKWQITATTFWCDTVSEYVTVTVSGDWSYKCMWSNKYKAAVESSIHKSPRKIKVQISDCQGPSCKNVLDFRDKLIKEELIK